MRKNLSHGQGGHVVKVLAAVKKSGGDTKKASKLIGISQKAVESIVKEYSKVSDKLPEPVKPISRQDRIAALVDKQLGVREKVVDTQDVLLDRIKELAPRTQDIAKVGVALGYVSKVIEAEEEKQKEPAGTFYQQINNLVISGQVPDITKQVMQKIKK